MTLRAGMISLVLATAIATAAVFVPIAQAQSFTVLYNFTAGLDGANPYTGLTMDRAGNLYGTTPYGGLQSNDCYVINGCGTVFKLARQGSGWVFRSLYQFKGIPTGDGANPLARAIFGPDGALYGTTEYGGTGGNCSNGDEFRCGTVFKLTPPPVPCRSFSCNWVETQLYNFMGAGDGGNPTGEIAFDAAGDLYGSTEDTVYELTSAQGSWTHSVLHTFTGLDGYDLFYGVQLDTAGNVYGTNVYGGTNGEGVVFQLVPSGSGWTLNVLYNFSDSSEGLDSTGVIVGPGGNLFAGTANGSPNPVVYELSPSNGNWSYSTLYTFTNYSHCCGPAAKLMMDSAGNLYGTTEALAQNKSMAVCSS